MDSLIKNIIKNPYDADSLTQEELEQIITLAADKFFNTKKPIMEDNVYDILIDFLRTKFPKSKVLKSVGTKLKSKNKVKLDYRLGSMDKFKPGYKELEKWTSLYRPKYVISDKLDGISALLIYRTNKTINLYTRGTALEGLDITPLIKYFDLPTLETIVASKIKASKSDIVMAFRGELIIDKETFTKNWSKVMKNARNTVSGLVNSKNINPQLAIDTKLVLYEIVDPLMTIEDQYKTIKKLGFNTVTYKIVSKIDYESLSEYLKKRRSDSEFMVDGIIVTHNEIHERNTKSNPEYAFAFKDILEDQVAKATINTIEWNISKDGLIKPVLILDPVQIGGVEISRVTGHNAKNVVDNKLGPGAVIELIRSGDVIPYIQKVIKPGKVVLPTGKWHWNSTNVDIICDSLDTNEVLIKNIYYFFSSLDTKGLGEKIVEKLVNAGFNSVKKILQATETDFLKAEGFKEKSAKNLVESIKKAVTNIKLTKFMAATNKLGAGLGEERMKQIIEKYPNLLSDYKKWSETEFVNKLKELSGWEEKTSSLFVSNFDTFINFYKDIQSLITIEAVQIKKITKNKYTDMVIVMSGFRDAQLQKFLEDSGAKLTNSVSKNTDFLIVKDEATIADQTGKVKKALELGVDIITKDQVN
uniref:DNA ligase (NAD(+)) n=1 Tax=viral metagenome TaxID=1070528 RepID=A0A6C0DAF7_9ZZZZ